MEGIVNDVSLWIHHFDSAGQMQNDDRCVCLRLYELDPSPFHHAACHLDVPLVFDDLTSSWRLPSRGLLQPANDSEYNFVVTSSALLKDEGGSQGSFVDPNCQRLSIAPDGSLRSVYRGRTDKLAPSTQGPLYPPRRLNSMKGLQVYACSFGMTAGGPTNFADLSVDRLLRLRTMGYNAILLQRVQLQGASSSFPRSLVAADEQAGTLEDLQALVLRCRCQGFVVGLDLVLSRLDKDSALPPWYFISTQRCHHLSEWESSNDGALDLSKNMVRKYVHDVFVTWMNLSSFSFAVIDVDQVDDDNAQSGRTMLKAQLVQSASALQVTLLRRHGPNIEAEDEFEEGSLREGVDCFVKSVMATEAAGAARALMEFVAVHERVGCDVLVMDSRRKRCLPPAPNPTSDVEQQKFALPLLLLCSGHEAVLLDLDEYCPVALWGLERLSSLRRAHCRGSQATVRHHPTLAIATVHVGHSLLLIFNFTSASVKEYLVQSPLSSIQSAPGDTDASPQQPARDVWWRVAFGGVDAHAADSRKALMSSTTGLVIDVAARSCLALERVSNPACPSCAENDDVGGISMIGGAIFRAQPRFLQSVPTIAPIHELKIKAFQGRAISEHISMFVMRDDLLGFGLGGNKVRKVDFIFGKLAVSNRPSCVIIANESSFSRNSAAAAYTLGMKMIVVRSGGEEDRNKHSSLFFDAHNTTVVCAGRVPVDQVIKRLVAELSGAGETVEVLHPGGSDRVGTLGFVGAVVDNIVAAYGSIHFDHIFVPTGSCATLAGIVLGLALCRYSAVVHGISISADVAVQTQRVVDLVVATATDLGVMDNHFPDGVMGCIDLLCIVSAVGPGYAQPSEEGSDACIAFRKIGLQLDEVYGGKAAGYMLRRASSIHHQHDERVVQPARHERWLFLHTGGNGGVYY